MSTRIVIAAVLQYSHFFKVLMFMVCWLRSGDVGDVGWGGRVFSPILVRAISQEAFAKQIKT